MAEHRYAVALVWSGNTGSGTADARSYTRDHVLSADGKPDLLGSSDHARCFIARSVNFPVRHEPTVTVAS